MNLIYLILSIFLFLIILIVFSKVEIDLKIIKEGTNDEIIIKIYAFYGLIKYKLELPVIDMFLDKNFKPVVDINTEVELGKNENFIGENKEKLNFNELIKIKNKIERIYYKYKKSINYIRNKLILNKMSWNTEIGLDDAAITAITVGIFWNAKYSFVSIINKFFNLKNTYLNIFPSYSGNIFKTNFHCIISLKVGYIIIATFKILL